VKPRSIDYADLFIRSLAGPTESVLAFGLAQWKACTGQADRIGKAGGLVVSTERVVHWSDGEISPDLVLPLASLDLELGRKQFPNMREVLFRVTEQPAPMAASFLVARPFADRLAVGVEQARTVAPTQQTRGVWMSVMDHDGGGPGTFLVRAGKPVFITDRRRTYDLSWELLTSWSARSTAGVVMIGMAPAVGARLRLETDDVATWSALLTDRGVPEQPEQPASG
jgi:hypothetical protein